MKDLFGTERNKYFYGKLLTVRDFELEQKYHITKRRLVNRAVLGAGIVCGMGVTASDDTTLMIESGLALDYSGREILVPEPIIRKLAMIDGYTESMGKETAYLCMKYAELETEPVNAVGADSDQSRQYNRIQETYSLYISAEQPDYISMLRAMGYANVNILYSDKALTLLMYAPEAVCQGEEFMIKMLIIKNRATQPVGFHIEGISDFVEAGKDGTLTIDYRQSPEERSNVWLTEFKVRAQSVSGVMSSLWPEGAKLRIEEGDHVYTGDIKVTASVFLAKSRLEADGYLRNMQNLQKACSGSDLPIYLAKLELINSSGGLFIDSITDRPFRQLAKENAPSGQNIKENDFGVTCDVKSLEYWQNPDVRASYNAVSENLHFDFGIPVPQVFDYTTAHGTVDITLSSGMRVNTRYVSDEIPHGLGIGAVNVTLSVEFEAEDSEPALLMGSSEVFKNKSNKGILPWVDTAVMLYPNKGTMRIGLWLHDNVDGSKIRVHYFAQKPERDTHRMRSAGDVTISVMPEVARVAPREKVRFKSIVLGSEDRAAIWHVKDENGGSIDYNGIYQAPEVKGTYEIIAAASADEKVFASAFVIVE